jgi:SNF2 family DNA or RNA helicase
LAADAKSKADRAAKKEKKRKSKGGKESSSKKSKKNDGTVALKTAQDKHAKVVAASKPIFAQPPNLASGCILKDYQLEGVRWLVSLFENGVSGILADEVCKVERAVPQSSTLFSNLVDTRRWDSERLFKSLP